MFSRFRILLVILKVSFMSILVILEVFLVILDGPEVFWTFYEYFVHFGGQSILVIL